MTFDNVVTRVRDAIRRSLGRGGNGTIQLTEQGTALEPLGDGPVATPPIDIFENERELVLRADVPGASREGTRVAWDGRRELTFAVKAPALPGGTVWAAEYEPCEWYRSVDLPEYADGARAIPEVKDGVLTIHVPKRATASRLIPVKVG